MCDENNCVQNQPVLLPDARRRALLRGVAALPLAMVLADPMLARAAARRVKPVSIDTQHGTASGVIALPSKTPAPAVLLIHEWWGLNDSIKTMAGAFADAGFVALAVDLYDGQVATTPEQARTLLRALDAQKATSALEAWVYHLRIHSQGNGRVGTVGWCFGGGWSLNASLATPVDATVIYYGDVRKSAEQLGSLRGPVLGHFGTLDKRINARMVGGFEKAMAAANKPDLTVHWYVADHAFANPSGARYDEDDAKLAWARTLTFFHRHLG